MSIAFSCLVVRETCSEWQYCCPELSDPPGELTQLLVRGSVDQDSDPMVCCW